MKDPLFYRVMRYPLKGLLKLLFRPTFEGVENIPAEGRIILAGNHMSVLDCVLVGSATKRCVHFVAKAELMDGIFKPVFKGFGIIPVNRSSRSSGKAAVNTAELYLEDEKVVAIFPEGTVNRTEEPTMPFKGGAVKMAQDAKTKIVPFAITGGYKFFKKSVKVKFLPPIEIPEGKLKASNVLLETTVRDEIIKAGAEK